MSPPLDSAAGACKLFLFGELLRFRYFSLSAFATAVINSVVLIGLVGTILNLYVKNMHYWFIGAEAEVIFSLAVNSGRQFSILAVSSQFGCQFSIWLPALAVNCCAELTLPLIRCARI